jgi:hypothetical protein
VLVWDLPADDEQAATATTMAHSCLVFMMLDMLDGCTRTHT